MALTSLIHTFDIELADVDRHTYESLSLRVACHPSESEEYLLTRLIAYCLEYTEGIAFSKGLSEPDEPAITVRDLTGGLRAWIEIGSPDAARLHRASKASPRVAIYTHKDPAQLLRAIAGERIHRAESVELYAVDRDLLSALQERLDRRMQFGLSRSDGQVYVAIGGDTLTGSVERISLTG